MERSPERLAILARIDEFEKNGWFDRDVEDDPPTRPLRAGEVDYTGRKLHTRIATFFANRAARRFFDGCLRRHDFIIREVRGIENYLAVSERGVLLTCNHFNAFDNYAVYKAIEAHLGHRNLWKIIREGNFTSFPGLFGYFFRHCNTLPLSSRLSVMRELIAGVSVLLERGEKILIYPEQGMWWNYRKPRPCKEGAYRFAAHNQAPVLPLFITTEDTEEIGADGFPVLAYTVHILPALFPDPGKSTRENCEMLARENYRAWKKTYEDFYGIPLTYTTEGEVSPCSI